MVIVRTVSYNPAAHRAWHSSLVPRDDSASASLARRALLAAAEDGPGALAAAIRSGMADHSHDPGHWVNAALPVLPAPLPPGAVHRLSPAGEAAIAGGLHPHVSAGTAAEPAYWAACHAAWIADGCFGAGSLAEVFCGGNRAADTDRGRVGNLLRRTGGLAAESTVAAPMHCPVARALWRRRFAHEASELLQDEGRRIGIDAVHEVLSPNTVWRTLLMMSVRQATILAHSRARVAIVAALYDYRITAGAAPGKAHVKAGALGVARLAVTHHLTTTAWADLYGAAADAMANPPADTAHDPVLDADERDDS